MKSILALVLIPALLAACASHSAGGKGITQTSAATAVRRPAYQLTQANDGSITIQYDTTRTTASSMLQVAQNACSKRHRDADLKGAIQGNKPNVKIATYRCQGGHSYR